MPEIIITLISAFSMYVLFYLVIDSLDKKVHLGLARKRNRIISRSVYSMGIVMAMTWIVVSLMQEAMAMTQSFLTICTLWALAVLAVTDWEKRIIPNGFLMFFLMIWVAIMGINMIVDITNGAALLFSSLAGGITGGLLFLVCFLLSHRQLGAGDVKLIFVLGLYLTEKKILGVIFAGMILCCIFTLMQLVRKKGQRKGGVPLAPFLFLGTLIVLLV